MGNKSNHVLFICKYNRFRSVLAEGFFNKYNTNRSFKAKSAGVIHGMSASEAVAALAKKLRITIKKVSESTTSHLLMWEHILVIVADDVPPELFKENKAYGKKTIVWNIPDAETEEEHDLMPIANLIEKKVKELVEELQNG